MKDAYFAILERPSCIENGSLITEIDDEKKAFPIVSDLSRAAHAMLYCAVINYGQNLLPFIFVAAFLSCLFPRQRFK